MRNRCRRNPRLTTGIEDFPSSVTVTRDRHPLQGCVLRVLGRMHRHGAVELLVVLPDGSKTLLPAVFTDAVAARRRGRRTVGSIEDLEQLAVVVESLLPPAVGAGSAEDATGIPIKEDPGASDESVGVRPRRRGAGPPPAAMAAPEDLPDRDREAAVAKLASLIARYHAAEGSADDHE